MKLYNKLEIDSTLKVGALPTASTSNFSVLFENGGLVSKRVVGDIINKNTTDFIQGISNSFPSIFNYNTSTTPSDSNLVVSFKNQLAGTVFAAPTTLNGTPSFRKLIDSDLSETSIFSQLGNYVTLDTEQDITGKKVFSAPYHKLGTNSAHVEFGFDGNPSDSIMRIISNYGNQSTQMQYESYPEGVGFMSFFRTDNNITVSPFTLYTKRVGLSQFTLRSGTNSEVFKISGDTTNTTNWFFQMPNANMKFALGYWVNNAAFDIEDVKMAVRGGIYSSSNVFANGFKKHNSSDDYVILGGGGHKLISDFALATDIPDVSGFVPYTGATANVNLGTRSITSTGGFIGNATTATTLATARTINGTSFNGSANITTANWGTARNITIGNTTKSVNGSANVSWSLAEIGINTGDFVDLISNQTIEGSKRFTDLGLRYSGANTSTSSGWHRIAKVSGRGYFEVGIHFIGGSFTPSSYICKGFLSWSGSANQNDIQIDALGRGHYVRGARIVQDGDIYLEVDFFTAPATNINQTVSYLKGGTASVELIPMIPVTTLTGTLWAESLPGWDHQSTDFNLVRAGNFKTPNYGTAQDWYNAYLETQNLSTNYITTNTNQTGLTGNKTTSGVWTFSSSTATSLVLERTGSDLNNAMLFRNGSGNTVYLGQANSSVFAIAGTNVLNTVANRWMWVDSSGLVSSQSGFSKTGATNNDVLLGSGGHRPVSDFALANGSNLTSIQTWRNSLGIGTLNDLTTTDKSNLVNAINEVNGNITNVNDFGGVNLVDDSHFYNGNTNGWNNAYGTQVVENHIYKKTFTQLSSAARIERVFPNLKAGIYTLTIFVKTPVAISWYSFVNGNPIIGSVPSSPNEFARRSVTFNVPNDGNVTVRGYVPSIPVGSVIEIDWFKLETGYVGSDWTPILEEQKSDWNETNPFKDSYIKNKPEIPTVNDGQLSLTTGNGLTGSATFTANQSGNSSFSVGIASTHKLPTITEWNALPTTNTITRLRGTSSGTYTSGDITLLAGANTTITQSGSNITIASTNTNTTYSAGTGLSLTGTTFGQTITTSGTGTFVTGITQTTDGFQVNLGTPPNTTYSAGTLALLQAGTNTSNRVWSPKILADGVIRKGVNNVNPEGQPFSIEANNGRLTLGNWGKFRFEEFGDQDCFFEFRHDEGPGLVVGHNHIDYEGTLAIGHLRFYGNGVVNTLSHNLNGYSRTRLPVTGTAVERVLVVGATMGGSTYYANDNGLIDLPSSDGILSYSSANGIIVTDWNSFALSEYAMSLGYGSVTSGNYATSVGGLLSTTGFGSTNQGYSNSITKALGYSLGAYNSVRATLSGVFGIGLVNRNDGAFIVGRYNSELPIVPYDTTSPHTQAVFAIGAGRDDTDRYTALTVYGDGRADYTSGYDDSNWTDNTLVTKKWVQDNAGGGLPGYRNVNSSATFDLSAEYTGSVVEDVYNIRTTGTVTFIGGTAVYDEGYKITIMTYGTGANIVLDSSQGVEFISSSGSPIAYLDKPNRSITFIYDKAYGSFRVYHVSELLV